ncbi:hypothetical protein [Halorhodospira sp. 9622]|uniref:hypothetical protein n=1 Tax=Halorhodospira sp. 9622 TaxID=2899136 RepID=UPI001EE90AB9|nr:hypothetical protein [Halorhodospira sp. 9622]MCG5539321.1 hypothetical protein [Halorhodospira sp. 9622]
MMRAGTEVEITQSSGEWLILDIGFANKSRSCGLLINNEQPVDLQFSEAVKRICDFIVNSRQPVNLMIEAPLSVAFDDQGNPTGRSVEKQGGKTRYWYFGLGCTIIIAALYLLREVFESKGKTEVRLFEGFVSFKDKNKKSNHSRDVKMLREVVEDRSSHPGAIVEEAGLRIKESDTLKSAFMVAGMDVGVPPVIVRNG